MPIYEIFSLAKASMPIPVYRDILILRDSYDEELGSNVRIFKTRNIGLFPVGEGLPSSGLVLSKFRVFCKGSF